MTVIVEGSVSAQAYKQSPPTAKEREDVEMLISMMGSHIDPDVALTVLRRNWGDIQKAASALLEGDTGAGTTHSSYTTTLPTSFGKDDRKGTGSSSPPPSKPEKDSDAIIDLTGDEELSQALQASLNEPNPNFGPSNRAPDPQWAMVSSNKAVEPPAYDNTDDELKRALEASLMDTDMTLETYDELPLEQRVRKGDCPVTLRPTMGTKVCAALVTHSLFFVPQIRHHISQYRPYPQGADETNGDEPIEVEPPTEGSGHILWSVLETFVYMDLARTTELNIDQAMGALDTVLWSSPSEQPGDVAYQSYTKLAWTIEEVLQELPGTQPSEHHRLLHFRYGLSDAEPPTGPLDKRWDMSVVKVAVRGTPNANDLLSCLSLELSPIGEDRGRQQVIFKPSDVVAFQLLRDNIIPAISRSDKHAFVFPTSVYLDQFLSENSKLASEKRNLQRELRSKVKQLKERKEQLKWHEGRDVLKDLRSSLHYYENIADDGDDEARKIHIKDMADKLRKVLVKIENELQSIDVEIKNQETTASSVYDCPELRKHRYDLRVVLVHDGLYGRAHIYSYVKQKGKWWKVVDYLVSEVSEETVLSDATGLHFNAGPFFLIYSRALSEQEEAARPDWPVNVKNSVKYNNQVFFASLPPEIASAVEDPNSPPTSPTGSTVPLPEQSTSAVPMDTSA